MILLACLSSQLRRRHKRVFHAARRAMACVAGVTPHLPSLPHPSLATHYTITSLPQSPIQQDSSLSVQPAATRTTFAHNLEANTCYLLRHYKPVYAICTRTYAHKKPSPKTKPLKPHLRDVGKKGDMSVMSPPDVNEEDVIWQDDPDYEQKMAKMYPEKEARKYEEESEEALYTEILMGKKGEQIRKKAAEEDDESEVFDGNSHLYKNVDFDIFDDDGPLTEAEKKSSKETKVFVKTIIEKSSDAGSDMKYIENTFKKHEKSRGGGWQEWKDDDEEIERQKKNAGKQERDNERLQEDDEEDKPKPKPNKVEDKKANREAARLVTRDPVDYDRLYVGKTRIPEAFDKYFENVKEPEEKKKKETPKDKKRKGYRDPYHEQPKVRQLRVANVVQEIIDNAIYDKAMFFEPTTARVVHSGMVITDVEMTRDMRFANIDLGRIWYSELPDKRKEYEIKLNKMRPYLRKQLAKEIEHVLEDDNIDKLIELEHIRVYGVKPKE